MSEADYLAYENHPQDGRVKPTGGVAAPITGLAGTGGNNLPFVMRVELTGYKDTGRGDYWSDAPAAECIRAEGENRPSRPTNLVVEREARAADAPVDAKGVWRDDKSMPPCFHMNTRNELIPTEIPGALLASNGDQCQSYIPVENPDRKRLPCVAEPPRCFTQNQRDELRLLGGDGEIAGAVSAEPGVHQQNYLAQSPVIYTIDSDGGNSMKSSNPHSGIHEADTAKTLDTTIPTPGKGQGGQMIVEASEVVPPAYALAPMLIGRKPENGGNGCGYHEEVAYTQDSTCVMGVVLPAAVEPTVTQYGAEIAGTLAARHDSSPTLDQGQNIVCRPSACPFPEIDTVVDMMVGKTESHLSRENINPTITTAHGECHAIAYNREDTAMNETVNETASAAPESAGGSAETTARPVACVRRLLPIEAERLMGFPDNHTKISYRGKPVEECPDAPRYKACGNSMCINVMRWIGKRIDMVEAKIRATEAASEGAGEAGSADSTEKV